MLNESKLRGPAWQPALEAPFQVGDHGGFEGFSGQPDPCLHDFFEHSC